MLRFAANLSMMFTEWGFLDRFAAAADAGFTAVECQFPYEYSSGDIALRLQRHRLQMVLFNLPPGDLAAGERGMAALPERSQAFRASVAKALDFAEATGCGLLHVMSGIADRSSPLHCQAYVEALRYACASAAARQIGIVIEPLNTRDTPGYFLNDFPFAVEIIKSLETPNLKLQFDVYHRQILHGDVLTSLATWIPLIGHIQIAAVPDRHEPGTGELDDARLFRAIDELPYEGFVGCEYRPRGGTLEGLGWMRQ